jgi:DNA replication and repair protein RecF
VDGSRRRYLDLLAPQIAEFGQRLLTRPLTLRYRRGWADGEGLAATLEALRDRDRENGSTEAGPHRAELVLLLDERRVQDEASRGQQKLTAAALVLAQVAVESALDPGRSVVVIDDPAAELDGQSLDRLLEAVDQLKVQLVLTALASEHLPPAQNYPVFHVEQGSVRTL